MKKFLHNAFALLLTSCVGVPLLHAAVLPNRLARTAAATEPMALPQGVSPRLRSSTALGHLDGDTRLETMALVLTPSAAQSAALDQLLADQQNPASPRYHQWLTPAQFGAQFGISDSDLQVLKDWLTSQGLQVQEVSPSRNRITFSGTSSTVEAAFHTEFTRFRRGDQQFFENSSAPQIPAALQNVVGAVTGLSSYRLRPQIQRVAGKGPIMVGRPDYNAASGNHYVTPWDFRQIYNANGLFNAGQTGTGVKIAVLGQSSIDLNQIAYFQGLTGQTAKAPTVLLLPGTGVSTAYQGDETESESDVEYAGGVAPGATILFLYAGNSANSSVADALNYAITNNVAPILTYSYGGCEAENSSSALQGEEGAFLQAAAQGQTVLVAGGDSGAAGCEDPGVTTAYDGLQVSYPASSPNVTAIGGTSFNDTTGGTYWNSSNNSQAGSALGYIPESVWNESATNPLSASGGGFSRVFGKPSWQVATGVPNDGARDIPDISFTAAGHDAYLICTSDSSFTSTNSSGVTSTGACTSSAFGIGRVAGTSLPTPAFAGALAMILNANNTTGLGNLNPLLYRIYGTNPSIFHDVTSGNNVVPCVAGTQGCTNGSLGYSATTGYDLASGLGSLDIGALSAALPSAAKATSRTPIITLSNLLGLTNEISAQVNVSGTAGGPAPTGPITISVDGGTPQTYNFGSSTTSTGGVFTINGTFANGSHSILVSYQGDSYYAATSSTFTVFVPSGHFGNFTLAVTPTTVTINSSTAHTGTWTLNFTSVNSYTGVIGINTPIAATGSSLPATGCFLGQGDLSPSANATVSTTITYSYSASDCSGSNVIMVFGDMRKAIAHTTTPALHDRPTHRNLPLLAIGFTGLIGSSVLRRRRMWATGLLALAAMAATAGLSGCGSGAAPLSSGTTGGSGNGSGTASVAPKGTYNIVFSASDFTNSSASASANVTLVIQ